MDELQRQGFRSTILNAYAAGHGYVQIPVAGALLVADALDAAIAKVTSAEAELAQAQEENQRLTRRLDGSEAEYDEMLELRNRERDRAERAEAELGETEPCVWQETETGDWETDCENLHVIIDGGPTENRFQYCCYCGQPLIEQEWDGKR
jgi:hypothetical protein